jgi:hypothetical protein
MFPRAMFSSYPSEPDKTTFGNITVFKKIPVRFSLDKGNSLLDLNLTIWKEYVKKDPRRNH